jgi:hypothetical protein
MGGLAVAKKWSAEADEALKKAIAEGVSLQRLAIRFKIRKQGIALRARHLGLKIEVPRRLSQVELGFKIRKR